MTLLNLALLGTLAAATTLPYNPSRIFVPTNESVAYVVDSTSSSDGSSTILSIDLTRDISNTTNWASAAGSVSISGPANAEALDVIQDTDGSLLAISGDCQAGGSSARIARSKDGQTWIQADLSGEQNINYLASGIAFSTKTDGASNSSVYMFGGMCPSDNASSWVADATYSASVLKLSQNTTDNEKGQFSVDDLGSNGGPVAEAGLSITPLAATSHDGLIIQQQYVLIGGHTQSAFINMSQVAIFTVPQESWSFMPVQQPQAGRIDLTTRQTVTDVEPRSGHTSVLSQDGTKIIVYGGWVGDITSAAQPQLAILEVGSGFGGDGQWEWSIPTTASGSTTSAGLFGHGAAILPGNVMMIYGGYSIPASSSTTKRSDLVAQSTPMFFNVSSSQWLSTYTLPAGAASQSGSQNPAGTENKQKIGLAVGLTVGLLILIALVAFYFWYTRRLKKKRQDMARGLMSRSSDGSYTHIDQPFLEKTSIDGRGGEMTALNQYWMDPHTISNQPINRSAATGASMDVPSPTRGLRKSSTSRNYQYHAAPRYDDKRVSRHSGNIHPIAELDNEDATSRVSVDGEEQMTEAQRQLKAVEAILNANRSPERRVVLNPLRSHPVSPEAGEVVSTSDNGRVSPTKTDERTSSTLSEKSHRSILSDNSITRTMSARTGALLAAAAAAHVRAKAVEVEASTSSDSRSNTMSTDGRTSPISRRTVGRSSTNGSSAGAESRNGAYAESFRTARSNATYDDAVLPGPVPDRDDPYRRALAAHGSSAPYIVPSRRRQGIFGSLRKAMGAIAPLPPRSGHDYDQLQSATSSPIKERHNPVDSMPRRTVSDGGALLRQKRGKSDWADPAFQPYRDDPDPGDWGDPGRTSSDKQEAEEDWNVEDAAEKRDVQIMFTVPKTRLRVVNADMERASLRSVSDPLSRAGSTRAPRHEPSTAVLQVQAAVEQLASSLETVDEDKDKIL